MIGVKSLEKRNKCLHYPVMWKEALSGLGIAKCKYVVDCTAGLGGHAYKMLEACQELFYLGIDRDGQSLRQAGDKLKPFEGRFTLVQENFRNIDSVSRQVREDKADAVFFDLGVSSYQLADPQRGFSFLKNGSLDMRFDENDFVKAFDLVNNLSQRELVEIFKKFGQERYSRRIARRLVEERKDSPISTTLQLAGIIEKSVPPKSRFGRIHPATRVFQALRIAVNRELDSLEAALPEAIALLKKGARIAVISFHSLEDRIVKHTFRDFASKNILSIITKKPLVPDQAEITLNRPSRPAKLRIAEKIS